MNSNTASNSILAAIGNAMDNMAAHMSIKHNIKMMNSIANLELVSAKLVNDTASDLATFSQQVTTWKAEQTPETIAVFDKESAHLSKLFATYTTRPSE